MQTVKFPSDYQRVMPYLIVEDALGFLKFTKDVFGATDKLKHMRDENTVAHAEIMIGDSVIMFADATDAFHPRTAGMFVYVADVDETYHRAIEEGSVSIMPVSDQPYGRSGGVTDPYGNQWWITTHV